MMAMPVATPLIRQGRVRVLLRMTRRNGYELDSWSGWFVPAGVPAADTLALSEALLAAMDDEEVIQALLPVRGIGRWTAEMFLIFSLGRPDVLAVDDLGLRNAMRKLHDLEESPSAAQMRMLAEPWRPFRSVASWYLWRSLDNEPKV